MSVAALSVAPEVNGHPHTPVPVYDNSPTFSMACRLSDSTGCSKLLPTTAISPSSTRPHSAFTRFNLSIPRFTLFMTKKIDVSLSIPHSTARNI